MKFPRVPYWYLLAGPFLMDKVGTFMNKIAMAVNGGFMPVQIRDCDASMIGDDTLHGCMTAATHLKVFCDWINYHSAIVSLGDLLIEARDNLFLPCLIIWATVMIVKFKRD